MPEAICTMCPAMSFNIFTLRANRLELMCYNFPFAVFTQLIFIQPFIRKIFKALYAKKNAAKA